MTTVRDVVFDLFSAMGVDRIFGNPGSTELPMFKDFPDRFGYILGLQESVAMGMADGFAQASGGPAVVNLHSAVGVGHAAGNIFTAFKNQSPVIIIAGQQARAILPYEPFLFADRATEFPRPYVKYAVEPARAEDVPQAITRAYYEAMQAPRGPVLVSVPSDDWDRPCDPISLRQVHSRHPGDPEALSGLADALTRAAAPALVLGAGVARDKAWADITRLAEIHKAAIWTAPFAARETVDETHPLFQGFLQAGREAIVKSLAPYDLVLVMGGPLSLYHTEGEGPHIVPGTQLFQIGDHPGHAAWAPAGTSIIANIALAAQKLTELSDPPNRKDPAPRPDAPVLDGADLSAAFLCRQIAKLRPADALIVEEAPSTRGPMHDYLPITIEDGFYTCASGGLGYSLPAAVGVAMAKPGRPVIALIGDGSAMYSIQALWSAAQHKLPITTIIVRNNAYAALDGFAGHFGINKPVGTGLPDLDFVALAESQGVSASRVTKRHDLNDALTASFSSKLPTLIEVQTA